MQTSWPSTLLVIGLFSFASPFGLARDCGLVINVLEVHGGSPLPYKVTGFTEEIAAAEFAASFEGLRAAKIPCGVYRYAVVRADIEVPQPVGLITGWVTLDDPRQRLTVHTNGTIYDATGQAYAVDGARPKDHPILGTATGQGTATGLKPQAEPAIVRLIDVRFNREAREVEVDPDGHFEFHTPEQGSYVALLLQGTHLLAAQDLVVDFKTDSTKIAFQIPPAP